MMKLLAVLWSAHSPSFGIWGEEIQIKFSLGPLSEEEMLVPVLGRGDSHILSTHNCTVYCWCTVDGV